MSKNENQEKRPSDCLPSFPAYYDTGRKDYWIEDSRRVWIEIAETSMRRHLRGAGISQNYPDGEIISPLDRKLNELQTKFNVAYAGPLAGYAKGVYEISSSRILVTSSPKFIVPKPGSSPLIEALLKNMFDDPLCDQRPYFFGWIKVELEALRAQKHRPGQALALAGPGGSGKSLVQNLITEIFGGRIAKPYRYMRDETQFNGELFGAEHLMIEDEVASTDIRTRRNFGARIKEITVNQTQSFHAKNRQAMTLTPSWRLTITLNDEAENLLILPPIDESLADKIILLKVNKKPMPMPTQTHEHRTAFWNALIEELPAFLWFLERWEIPPELKSERYGITHYHHPELLEAIDRLAPQTRLLWLIDAELFPDIRREKAKALLQGQFVLLAVFLRHVAQIIGLMPLNACQNVVLGKPRERVRGGNDVAQPELRNAKVWCVHNPKSSIVAAMPSSSSPRISTKPAFRAALSGSGLASFEQHGQRNAQTEAAQKKADVSIFRRESASLKAQIQPLRTHLLNLHTTATQIAARLQESKLPETAEEELLLSLIGEQSRMQAQLLALVNSASNLELALDAVTTAAALTTLQHNIRNKEKAVETATRRRDKHQPWLACFTTLSRLVSS
jgi:hypothetical protein